MGAFFCGAGRSGYTPPEDFASSGTWLPRSMLLYMIVNCSAAVAFTSLLAGSAVCVLVVKTPTAELITAFPCRSSAAAQLASTFHVAYPLLSALASPPVSSPPPPPPRTRVLLCDCSKQTIILVFANRDSITDRL